MSQTDQFKRGIGGGRKELLTYSISAHFLFLQKRSMPQWNFSLLHSSCRVGSPKKLLYYKFLCWFPSLTLHVGECFHRSLMHAWWIWEICIMIHFQRHFWWKTNFVFLGHIWKKVYMYRSFAAKVPMFKSMIRTIDFQGKMLKSGTVLNCFSYNILKFFSPILILFALFGPFDISILLTPVMKSI